MRALSIKKHKPTYSSNSWMASLRTAWVATKILDIRRRLHQTPNSWPQSRCREENPPSLNQLRLGHNSSNSLWTNTLIWESPLVICFQMTRGWRIRLIRFRVAWQQPRLKRTLCGHEVFPSSATSSTQSCSLQWSDKTRAWIERNSSRHYGETRYFKRLTTV